jgi:uncharacterized protein (TIGR00251 family)
VAQRIQVNVKPQAKKPDITKIAESEYRVAVCAPAQDGKANLAVIELLANYFSVSKSRIKIVRGHSSRHKLIEIGE